MSLEDWAVISATPASGDKQTPKGILRSCQQANALIELGLSQILGITPQHRVISAAAAHFKIPFAMPTFRYLPWVWMGESAKFRQHLNI